MSFSPAESITRTFDTMAHGWESPGTQRKVAGVLVAVFLLGLAAIELKRHGLMPGALGRMTPESHFYAVKLAFTLVLIQEVVALIFVLPCSVSRSVGKQFEILSLILLRNSFKELIGLGEPVHIGAGGGPALTILADAGGALLIFAGLALYRHIARSRPKRVRGVDLFRFVAAKKAVALVLLIVFVTLCVAAVTELTKTGHAFDVFAVFYTVLIFSDILMVLIAQRFLPTYHAVFRNSGYAVATLLIRLALAAPHYVNAALGVAAMVFAISLTWAYNQFAARVSDEAE